MWLPRSYRKLTDEIATRVGRPVFFLALLVLAWAVPVRADEIVPFVIQDPLYRTNLGVSNLDPLPTNVSILLYDNKGHLAGQRAVQIPGLGFVNLREVVYFIFGYPSDLPFEGFIRLQSTNRIAAFASQIQYANDDPGIIPAMPEGASSFLLPITTSIEPWSSTLAVVNLTAQPTVVTIALRDEAGTLLAESERTLEGSSQWISSNIHMELGVQGVRGSLTVRSLNGAPLAVICRHTQVFTSQDVFQQPFDLRDAAEVFYLPYRFVKDLHHNWVVLNNPNSEPATVALLPFSPDGIALKDFPFELPAFGSALIPDSLFLAGQEDRAPFGVIRGTSTRPLSGLIIQTNLATRDTIHTNLITTYSPEIVIPSVTESATFSSNLLVSNLGDAATSLELRYRTADGLNPVPALKTHIQARGTVYLDKLLAGLGAAAGYGPLTLRSIEGQPLAVFSHVMNTANGARGSLNSVDSRLLTSKQLGQSLTLRWQYDPAEVVKIQEYRIYRADRAKRNFQRIASVPFDVLEYTLDASEAGNFVISVRAFDGVTESSPSNEVVVQVTP